MFYSRDILARKAALGQIWMAATLHGKISRKRLAKLDVVKICEEILNPSVPMALRLSGILMGGVVIVFERKVQLLYDDVSRLLVELNEAWRFRPPLDRTVLPKGKSQAKHEAVTLPENVMDMEVGHSMLFKDSGAAKFHGMRLEDIDEQYVNLNLDDDDLSRANQHHQAKTIKITLVDNFGPGIAETDGLNCFERFDRANDDTTVNVPSTRISSPQRQKDPAQEHHEAAPYPNHGKPQKGDSLNEQAEQKMKGTQPARSSKRKARGTAPQVIVDNQTMIPGNIYQAWLKDASSLVSKRRRVRNKINPIQTTKTSDLMSLPPVALMSYLENSEDWYYPKQLMQLWKECTEAKSPKPSSLDSIEMTRGKKSAEFGKVHDSPHGHCSVTPGNLVTPGSPGLSRRSASRSGGSGRGRFLPLEPEIPLQSGGGRPKRRRLSPRRSLADFDPVEEEFPLEQELRDFKLRRLSDIGPTPDLLEETELTCTPSDEKTEAVHSHLKLHFDAPGAPVSESLSRLADGMTTAEAARMFYHSCGDLLFLGDAGDCCRICTCEEAEMGTTSRLCNEVLCMRIPATARVRQQCGGGRRLRRCTSMNDVLGLVR